MGLLRWLNVHAERVVCIATLGLMTFAMTFQIAVRFFKLPWNASWADETAVYCLVWLTYFGASMAVTKRQHIRINLINELLPKQVQCFIDVVCNVVLCGFMLFLVYGSLGMIRLVFIDNTTSGTMSWLPMWVVYAGMPMAFLLTCVRAVQDSMRLVKE